MVFDLSNWLFYKSDRPLIFNYHYGFTERSKNQNKFGQEYPKNHFSNEDGGFCQITQGTRGH